MSPAVRPHRAATVWLASIIVGFALAGCEAREPDPATDSAAAVVPAAEAPEVPALTDSEIAHIVVTANAIDSTMGELASTRAENAAVKSFAATMVTDHGAVNQQAVELAQRLGVTPQANDMSRQLQQGADDVRTRLAGLTGAEFDRAYMQREVEYHQAVIDALDNALIPGARNAELKALLESARPAFVAHLERAREVQGGLGNR